MKREKQYRYDWRKANTRSTVAEPETDSKGSRFLCPDDVYVRRFRCALVIFALIWMMFVLAAEAGPIWRSNVIAPTMPAGSPLVDRFVAEHGYSAERWTVVQIRDPQPGDSIGIGYGEFGALSCIGGTAVVKQDSAIEFWNLEVVTATGPELDCLIERP